MSTTNRQLENSLLNAILNYIGARGWTNYDGFAERLARELSKQAQSGALNLPKALEKSGSSFFRLNSVSRQSFVSGGLEQRITDLVDFASTQPATAQPTAPEVPNQSRAPSRPLQNPAAKRARGKELPAMLVFCLILVFTLTLTANGFLSPNDISAALAAALVSGMIAMLVYGFTDSFERLFRIGH